MKKNIYITNVMSRQNNLLQNMYSMFITLASFPKLILEVFIRIRFGERYFNLGSAFGAAFFMFLIPLAAHSVSNVLTYHNEFQFGKFLFHYLTWYVYLAVYLRLCFKHYQTTKRVAGEFDFNWYSKSSGIINARFFKLRIKGNKPTVRQVEIFIEPLFFFLIGLVLIIFQQPLGLLLITCSIIYCMSYAALYNQGDQFILNMIDQKILNEELEHVFVDDKNVEDARGVSMRTKKPGKKDLRSELYNEMIVEDKIPEVQ